MQQQDAVSQAQLRPGTWQFDALHSQIMVSVRHMSVANLRAKLPRVTGKLEVPTGDPLGSSFEMEVDTRSVTTGHPPQEDFMRSEAWLDAENHPALTFRSTSIEPQDGNRFLIRGDLTVRGVTRPVEIPATFHGVIADSWGLRAGFTSQLTIDRTQFGITWNRVFDWGVMASTDMEISLDIELTYPDESLAQKPKA
ncbi:MAG TPA: YceI family protein [Candidatus Dormibacteraeota bacterium]|nr:YceI family protein [Candidatus Dormibacteraeota bacterium]